MFKRLTTIEDLELLMTSSTESPVAIFKHSNSCPISSGVRESVESCPETLNEIVVQTERELSNLVAEKTGVTHESPQVIVVFKGAVIYKASHYDINGDDISLAIKGATS